MADKKKPAKPKNPRGSTSFNFGAAKKATKGRGDRGAPSGGNGGGSSNF